MWKKGSVLFSCHKSGKLCKQYYPGEFLFDPNAVFWQQLKEVQVISTGQVPTESCSCHDLHLKKNTQRRSGLILILLQDGGTAQTATDQSNDIQQNLRTVRFFLQNIRVWCIKIEFQVSFSPMECRVGGWKAIFAADDALAPHIEYEPRNEKQHAPHIEDESPYEEQHAPHIEDEPQKEEQRAPHIEDEIAGLQKQPF